MSAPCSEDSFQEIRDAGSSGVTPRVAVPLLVLAFWPVWRWYLARVTNGSDEPLGLVALVTAAGLLPRTGWLRPVDGPRLLGAGAALAVYVAVYDLAPPLGRGALAMLALGCVAPRHPARPLLPIFALLLLSLPVVATLQFYLGFPLRALTASCAAHLLAFGGDSVVASGTVLHWAGEEILVDAPCSGIRMLWTASYLSATLAAVHRLPARAFLRLAQVTAAAVFVANLARTVVLFYLESGLWPNPAWAHEAAGVVLFVVAVGACTWAAQHLHAQNGRPAAEPGR